MAASAPGITKLAEPLVIGTGASSVVVPNRVFLAPMSGVSDLPFRRLAARYGAGLTVSEMVASREFVAGNAASASRADTSGLAVRMVQLAGRTPEWMAAAARAAESGGAQVVDINMGCPAKKVVGGASGSALMRDLDHALRMIEATVRAVRVPVTLKMRLGWCDDTINAPDLAARAEAAGVAMVTVHGRTREQFYTGVADWAAIRAVAERIEVPLVVNGDIDGAAAADRALARSGADAVMVGRAAYGAPWLPGGIAAAAAGRAMPVVDPVGLAVEHYEAMLAHYGPELGTRVARKHLGWYLDRVGVTDGPLRRSILTGSSARAVEDGLAGALQPRALAA